MPGQIKGSVTFWNVVHGPAPRSCAASSIARSKPVMRARTVTTTNAMLNITWEIRMVAKPRGTFSVTKNDRSAAPITISGAAMLRNMMASVVPLPR